MPWGLSGACVQRNGSQRRSERGDRALVATISSGSGTAPGGWLVADSVWFIGSSLASVTSFEGIVHGSWRFVQVSFWEKGGRRLRSECALAKSRYLRAAYDTVTTFQ